jgi:hypothetical protein
MRFLLILLSVFMVSSLQAFDESKLALDLGLRTIAIGNPWTFLGTSAIYGTSKLDKQMLVVDSVPGQREKIGVSDEGGYLILTIPRGKEMHTSIALVGFTRQEIETRLQQITSVRFHFDSLIIGSARADCFSALPTIPGLSQLGSYFDPKLGPNIMKCLGPMLQGAWESTGGAAQSAMEGMKTLIFSPKKFWDEKVAQMKSLKSFVGQFAERTNQMITALTNLPPAVYEALMCSFAGSLGTDALISIMTGGAGLVGVILRLDKYVMKVMQLERFLGLMHRMGSVMKVPQKFYTDLAAGKISDQVLDRIDLFSKNRMGDLALGSVSCAI